MLKEHWEHILINGNATVEAALRSSSLNVQVDQMKAMEHNI